MDSQHPVNSTYPVQYYLSQRVVERRKIQFSLDIRIVTVACNLIKLACMLLALRFHSPEALIIIGDAVESFLQTADPTTEDMCLGDSERFKQRPWKKHTLIWKKSSRRWHSSISFRRWWSCKLL